MQEPGAHRTVDFGADYPVGVDEEGLGKTGDTELDGDAGALVEPVGIRITPPQLVQERQAVRFVVEIGDPDEVDAEVFVAGASRALCSARQLSHHDAQKLSTTMSPLKSLSRNAPSESR